MLDTAVMNSPESKTVEINGVVIGDVVPIEGGKFTVRGLRETWTTPDAAKQALIQRRQASEQLVEQHRKRHSGVRITIGKTLFDAVIENGFWLGRPIQENKSQMVVEVEHTDQVRASLNALIERLETQAKQATRLEGRSMRARALIGAARQQLQRL